MAQLRQITKYLTRSKYSHCIILRVPWAIKRYKYAILITLKQKMVKIASKEQQVFWFMEWLLSYQAFQVINHFFASSLVFQKLTLKIW